MHRGVREFVNWVDSHREPAELVLGTPAQAAELSTLEQVLAEPLPTDLRFVLTRFNGGELPVGTMLPAGLEPGSIGAAVREYAESVGADFLDPELLLPFLRTPEGSLLAFDRSGGPVSDTWPIVDYYPDTGDLRLMHRTFDGWCRRCVADWTSPDFEAEFSLDTYLRAGERHVNEEPDVATAHATVAHALRRAGKPEQALDSYTKAARCVPPLYWCDWEALKLAALLGDHRRGLEAFSRLAGRAPGDRWAARETSAGRVAEAAALLIRDAVDQRPWLVLMEQLANSATDPEERTLVEVLLAALRAKQTLPLPAAKKLCAVPEQEDPDAWYEAVRIAYLDGRLRDDDLLLCPGLRPLAQTHSLGDVLRIRRDF